VKPYSRISKENYEKAKEKGINKGTFRNRICKLGWTVEESLEREIGWHEKRGCEHNRIYESKFHKVKICDNCKKIIE
jgi:hypothetical protein